MKERVTGNGTEDDPSVLRTPPSQSEHVGDRDTTAGASSLVCIVAKTTLGDQQRCLEALHPMLAKDGDWMALGSAEGQNAAAEGTVEVSARSLEDPVGGWFGVRNGLRGRFANDVPPVWECRGLAELDYNPRTSGMRAR